MHAYNRKSDVSSFATAHMLEELNEGTQRKSGKLQRNSTRSAEWFERTTPGTWPSTCSTRPCWPKSRVASSGILRCDGVPQKIKKRLSNSHVVNTIHEISFILYLQNFYLKTIMNFKQLTFGTFCINCGPSLFCNDPV